jgi:hypothetical protein
MSNSAFTVGGGPTSGTLTSVGLTSDTLDVTNSPVAGVSGTMNIELPESVAGDNMILNGNFQVMQRGDYTSGLGVINVPPSTNGAYTFDRFQIVTNVNQQVGVIQYNDPTRPSGSFQALIRRNAGQTGEDPLRFLTTLPRSFCRGSAGRQVTLSVQLAHGPDFSPLGGNVTMNIYSGTGNNDVSILTGFTGQTLQATTTVAVSGGFVLFPLTTGILGSTVSQLAVEIIWTPQGIAGADDSLSLVNMKLELGSKATPFGRDVGTEIISQCQAFVCKSYNLDQPPGTITPNGYRYGAWAPSVTQKAMNITFPTTMFRTPTVAIYSVITGDEGKVTIAANTIDVPGFVVGQGQAGFVFGTDNATLTNDMAAHYFADAELY